MIATTQSKCLIITTDISVASGTTSGGGTYTTGDPVTLIATAKSGFVFVNWTVSGVEVSTSATYNFNAPASDTTYVANFAPEIVEVSTTGNLGFALLNDDSAQFDWSDVNLQVNTTGNLGFSLTNDDSAQFDGILYQPINPTTGNFGIELDYNNELIDTLTYPQIIRTK